MTVASLKRLKAWIWQGQIAVLQLGLIAVLLCGMGWPVHAQQKIPPLRGLVTDLTGTLTAEQRTMLESRLRQFEAGKGSQLAVLIVSTTAPETIEQYGIRVAEAWKLGRKKVDDGVILIVAKNDRTVRIEVGYGLEGVLTDLTTSRIIRETIVPAFQRGDFYAGIETATTQIMRLINGESLPPPARQSSDDVHPDLETIAPILLILSIVVGRILRRVLGRMAGAGVTAVAAGVMTWFLSGAIAFAVLGALFVFVFTLVGTGAFPMNSGSSHRGQGGGFGSGGGFGGGGGGGFGGGGGGGFGGGGSSGRW